MFPFSPGGLDPNNPEHIYNMAARGGAGRMRQQRFDEYYRSYPLVMAPGAERPELNHGSKILLPPSALDKVSRLHVQWPIMLELINGSNNTHTHAGVLEFVAEEGRAYIPQWMMQTLKLDVGDMIQIKTTSLELAKLVKLQPQSVSFLDISDPKAVLEKAFRNFAALTKGDVFNFEYNDEMYEMAVLDVKPETDKMGVCLIETDVSVDFAPPVGYVEPERQQQQQLAASSRGGSGTSTPRSLMGGPNAGAAAGLLPLGTMAQSINYGAIAPTGTAARAAAGNFLGEGQRLTSKKTTGGKASAATNSKSSSLFPAAMEKALNSNQSRPPAAGTSTANHNSTSNAPLPLRLPPNKLFLGYEITPVKTRADKEREAAEASKPHFAGQGQTLRGGKKKGGSDGTETPRSDRGGEKRSEESKGRRLDGRSA